MKAHVMCLSVGLVVLVGIGNLNVARADANLLLEACSKHIRVIEQDNDFDNENDFRLGYCMGFVKGVRGASTAAPHGIFCIPHEVTTDQLIRVLHKFLTDNPNMLHEPENMIAFLALEGAFPCADTEGE